MRHNYTVATEISCICLALACTSQAQTISTVAGGSSNPLGHVFAVAADHSGNLYIAATAKNQIFKLTLGTSSTLTVVAGNGQAGFTGDEGDPLKASLDNPTGLATDANGDLFIADQHNDRIRKVTFSSHRIDTVVGNGVHGYGGDGGDPLQAALQNPVGITIDSRGNLYIADQGNNRIRAARFGANPFISTVAGNGTAGFYELTDPQHDELSGPTGVACDSKDSVYIADQGNNRIRKLTFGSQPALTTVAGNGTAGFGGDNGDPKAAKISSPVGIAIDSSDNLYIADTGNNLIRKVTFGTTPVITTLAGNGTSGFSGDGGSPTNAELASPAGVAAGSDGNLYIADYLNDRVRQVGSGAGSGGGGGGSGKPVIYALANYTTNMGLAPGEAAFASGMYLADSNATGALANPQVFVNRVKAAVDFAELFDEPGSSGVGFTIPPQTSLGAATVVIVNDGMSSDPFQITLQKYAPAIQCNAETDQVNCGFHSDGTSVTNQHPAVPGETIRVFVDGLGAVDPPPLPTLTIGGQSITVSLREEPGNGFTAFVLSFTAPALSPGLYPAVLSEGGYSSPAGQFPVGAATTSVPTITAISPSSAPVGSQGFVLTVNGSGFDTFDVVAWNGSLLPTTFVNSSSLTATISSSLLTATGTANVQIGGGDGVLISNSLTFSILAPATASLNPSSTTAGHADFLLTVFGSSFINGSIVYFNGVRVNTTFVDSTQLTATVTSDLVSSPNTVQVQVLNLSTFSNQVPFTISSATNSSPQIQRIDNAYQVTAGFSPGVLAAAFGSNLADANQNWPVTDPMVLVNGFSAVIDETYAVSDGSFSIVFQIPPQVSIGTASVEIINHGVPSVPFTIQVQAYSPTIDTNFGDTPANTCACSRKDSTLVSRTNPAAAGDVLRFVADGLGAADPPPSSSLTIDGGSVAISLQKQTYDGGIVYYLATFTVPQLSDGLHPMVLSVAGHSSPSLFLPVSSITGPSLVVSQSGTTFRAVARSITTLERDVSVSSNGGVISWTATPSTFSGGDWLQIDRHSGTSDSSSAVPVIRITASAVKLDAGDYFGQVAIVSANSSSRLVVSVVFSVSPPQASPGASVEPTGMIFVSSPGSVPQAQIAQITNPSTAPFTFTSSASFSNSTSIWFGFQPSSGTVSPGPPQQVSVQPLAGLQTGIYTGSITFHFLDGSSRVVSLVWVVAPGAASSTTSFAETFTQAGVPRDANPACTATKLLAVFTSLPMNFSASVAYATSIDAIVVDDCGRPLGKGAGSVDLSFSDHNPELMMQSGSPEGVWSKTWTPQPPYTQDLAVTLTADSVTLHGSVTVRGSAAANPNVPVIHVGGVVSAASYVHFAAPGEIVAIFGDQLSKARADATHLPLTTQLSDSMVSLDGVKLPLFYANATQINAMLPYGLKKRDALPYSTARLSGF